MTGRCEELCHKGNCKSCPRVSFDELTCTCGAAVIYPPVACGTRPPECRETCTRSHACAHAVTHSCHSEDNCPPCTQLTVKMVGRIQLYFSFTAYCRVVNSVSDPDSGVFWIRIRNPNPVSYNIFKKLKPHKIILLLKTLPYIFQLISLQGNILK